MAEWNSEQYLKFKSQRTQPAIDLVKRIGTVNPCTVLDIGCGPANSTEVLRRAFPNARITGVDNSDNMIKRQNRRIPIWIFDIGETVYYHNMPSVHAMIEWVRGTRLLPYIQALNEHDAKCMTDEVIQKAIKIYKQQANGEIIFRFRRLFFTASN